MFTFKPLHLILTVLLALPMIAGCESTYVNIPPQEGDIADHDPNADNVREVMIVAVREVASEMPAGDGYRILLPAGSNYVTYDDVAGGSDLVISPKTANRMADQLPPIQVAQVRIRGWRSEVDVIRPFPPLQPEADPQLVTVRMGWRAGAGWQVRHVLPWNLNVDEALRESQARFEETPVANELQTPNEPTPIDRGEPVGSFEPVEPEQTY